MAANFNTITDLRTFLTNIKCSVGGINWRIVAGEMGPNGYYIQLKYDEADTGTGRLEEQSTRKWYVSSYATPSEVAQTVLKAALTSAEHMVREHFTYKGVPVFNPHHDIEELVTLNKRDMRNAA